MFIQSIVTIIYDSNKVMVRRGMTKLDLIPDEVFAECQPGGGSQLGMAHGQAVQDLRGLHESRGV